MAIAPKASTLAHPAVMPTSPASEPLRHIETSGFPYLSHVNIRTANVANAGANVVVPRILAICAASVAAAPLNPYHANQRIKQPKAPIGRLCPGIACALPVLLLNLPIRGPRIAAPISAVIPPTICITHEPAKSINPSFVSQP